MTVDPALVRGTLFLLAIALIFASWVPLASVYAGLLDRHSGLFRRLREPGFFGSPLSLSTWLFISFLILGHPGPVPADLRRSVWAFRFLTGAALSALLVGRRVAA